MFPVKRLFAIFDIYFYFNWILKMRPFQKLKTVDWVTPNATFSHTVNIFEKLGKYSSKNQVKSCLLKHLPVLLRVSSNLRKTNAFDSLTWCDRTRFRFMIKWCFHSPIRKIPGHFRGTGIKYIRTRMANWPGMIRRFSDLMRVAFSKPAQKKTVCC